MSADHKEYLDCGFSDYISKPINSRDLFATIVKLTGRKPGLVPAETDSTPDDDGSNAPLSDDRAEAFKTLVANRQTLRRDR